MLLHLVAMCTLYCVSVNFVITEKVKTVTRNHIRYYNSVRWYCAKLVQSGFCWSYQTFCSIVDNSRIRSLAKASMSVHAWFCVENNSLYFKDLTISLDLLLKGNIKINYNPVYSAHVFVVRTGYKYHWWIPTEDC